MPERKIKPVGKIESDLGLEGFENFFTGTESDPSVSESVARTKEDATNNGVEFDASEVQVDKLASHLRDLIGLSVDQRVETARIANQLIDNQRQLIATQQILIRLMEKSIELTRHITSIEEKLPVVFELPRLVEDLRARVAQMEGVEYR